MEAKLSTLTTYTDKISNCFAVAADSNDLLYFVKFVSKQLQEFAGEYWKGQSFLGDEDWYKLVTETSFEKLASVSDAYIFFNDNMYKGLTSPDKNSLLRAVTLIIKTMEHNANRSDLKPGLYRLE